MATNRWLESLKTLESKRENLRALLQAKGVAVTNNATLSSMLDKVSLLKDVNEETNEIYEPDSLWVFPDPNGSDELKTIRQIYDEDSMASNYTYRGIYLIYGEIDSFDLKAVMGSRSSADTFVTSDGVTYSDVTDTTLIHTWNKDYDVIDSDNNIVRYVKIYSNTSYNYVPGFYNQLIWAIHNFGVYIYLDARQVQANSNATPIAYTLRGCPLKILEWYNGKYFYGGYTSNVKTEYDFDVTLGDPKILKLHNCSDLQMYNVYTGVMTTDTSLEYLYIDISSTATKWTLAANATSPTRRFSWLTASNFKKLEINIDPDNNKLNQFEIALPRNYKDFNWLDKLNNLNYLKMYGPEAADYLYIPLSVKTLYLGEQFKLKNLDLSSNINLTQLNLSDMRSLRKLSLPSSLTSLSLGYINTLTELNVGENYNITTNLSYCINLKYESILKLLNNLKDLSGDTAKTLTLGATNLAKLTDEEKAIATNKNWTLA